MDADRQGKPERVKVPRLAFAMPVDPTGEASGVVNAEGERRRVGDRWSEVVDDLGMTVTVDTRDGALQVILTLRIDAYRKRDWLAADAMPTAIAVVPWAPMLAFAIEIDGIHACGFYPIGADPADALAVRERLSGDAEKTLVIVGVSRGRIRLLKRGLHLQRPFEIFAETCAATPSTLKEQDYEEALAMLSGPPDLLFREAIAIHLRSPCA